jgi:phage terminase large subunit GpA-like protein
MIATADLPDLNDASDLAECWAAFTPPEETRLLPWCEANIVTDLGRPYDRATYPHITAPGGPADAFDDPSIRTIALQWGVRLGKTFFGQCCCLKTAAIKPAPMMFVSSREKLAREQTERTYEMLRKSPTLRTLLARHRRLQRQDLIEFTGCKLFVAWAKSASTLADKKVVVGHGAEIDKWEHSTTSTEGDPLDLFEDRFNDDFIVRKIILEGTPAVKGRSRIERKRLLGSNCSYHVPCPHCKRFQPIEFGDGSTKHGIKWDVPPDGRRNVDLARKTAGYVCRHCFAKISSESRHWMMRRGVWAPEGCSIVDDVALAIAEGRQAYVWRGWKYAEWIAGKPLRDGEDASFHLSSLCALQIPEWGDFAKRFLNALAKKQSLRTFLNQWLALTWEDAERKTTWEQLGQRLIVDVPRGIVPHGFALVTCGVDKQIDHYVWCVDCWNHRNDSHTVDYGTCPSLEVLEQTVLDRRFESQDGGSLRIKLTLIDSGNRPAGVYKFCRRRPRMLPCKGSSSPLDSFAVKKKLGKTTSAPGQRVVFVDTQSTQDWIDQQLHVLKPGDEGAHTLFQASLGDHQDHLEQLLNDAPVADLDTSNNVRERWKRIDEHAPNDNRDCRRYGFAAKQIVTRGAAIRFRRPKDPDRRNKFFDASAGRSASSTPTRFPRAKLPKL